MSTIALPNSGPLAHHHQLACVKCQTPNGVAIISKAFITASVCYIGDKTKEGSHIVLWNPGDPGDPYKSASNMQIAYYRSTCGRTHACPDALVVKASMMNVP